MYVPYQIIEIRFVGRGRRKMSYRCSQTSSPNKGVLNFPLYISKTGMVYKDGIQLFIQLSSRSVLNEGCFSVDHLCCVLDCMNI